MDEPVFLTLDEVIQIHAHQIEFYGGDCGIRDMGLLESAIAQPSAGHADGYFHEDLFEMAAAYLYHITQNHPFVDGNKSTGAQAADVFLAMNGLDLICESKLFEEMVFRVANSDIGKDEIAEFLRSNCVEIAE